MRPATKILLAVAAILAVVYGCLAVQADQGHAAPASASFTPDPRFTGGRYAYDEQGPGDTISICIWQTFNSTQWYPGDVANAFEPAINTGWRGPTQNCSGFENWEILRYALYSEPDTQCLKWTGTSVAYPGHFYNRIWSFTGQYPTIWINTQYPSCWDTSGERWHWLSYLTGQMNGLAPWSDCDSNVLSVMNTCQPGVTLAQAEDRNRMTVLRLDQ